MGKVRHNPPLPPVIFGLQSETLEITINYKWINVRNQYSNRRKFSILLLVGNFKDYSFFSNCPCAREQTLNGFAVNQSYRRAYSRPSKRVVGNFNDRTNWTPSRCLSSCLRTGDVIRVVGKRANGARVFYSAGSTKALRARMEKRRRSNFWNFFFFRKSRPAGRFRVSIPGRPAAVRWIEINRGRPVRIPWTAFEVEQQRENNGRAIGFRLERP